MLSANARRNITRILPYGAIWLLFSIVYTLLDPRVDLANTEAVR